MVEKINIQKKSPPGFPAVRVKKVNRQDADAQKKGLDGQFEEEDEKNKKKKQVRNAFESTGIGDSKEIGKEPAETDNMEDRDFDQSKGTGDNAQGKLIDILV